MQVHKYDMQVTARCLNACESLAGLSNGMPNTVAPAPGALSCVHWNRWNRDLFNFWLHTIPSFLHWSRSIAAGGIWDNQPCQTNFAPPGLPDPGRIQKICVELGVLYELHFFSYVLFGKVPLISALYMRCSQAFLQQPHILSYFFRDKLATFWTHMAKWSSSVTSLCSAGRSNRAFRAQTLSPSRHFEPLTERLLKWFGGDFGI